MTDTNIDEFKRIAKIQLSTLSSEEDVKIGVVLPLLRALGYKDSEFNYEGRTGKGYVDVAGDKFPTGILVETKSPKTKLENYVEQLELYTFNKHHRERVATVAILTDGDYFRVYGLTEALRKGSLATHLMFSFRCAELATPLLPIKLSELLSKESNESGAIPAVIARYQQEQAVIGERSRALQSKIAELTETRDRINAQLGELSEELNTLVPSSAPPLEDRGARTVEGDANYEHPIACNNILRLLGQCHATSRSNAALRPWLDDQLVNKVNGIKTKQMVSFGLIELRKKRKIDYEMRKRKIGPVWLK